MTGKPAYTTSKKRMVPREHNYAKNADILHLIPNSISSSLSSVV